MRQSKHARISSNRSRPILRSTNSSGGNSAREHCISASRKQQECYSISGCSAAKQIPLTWDQRHLQSAWCDVTVSAPLRTFWLPASYLHIFDVPSDSPPVIKHWMASIKARSDGRTSGMRQLEITDAGIEARRSNRLWRTPEEVSWLGPGKIYSKSEICLRFRGEFRSSRVGRKSLSRSGNRLCRGEKRFSIPAARIRGY